MQVHARVGEAGGAAKTSVSKKLGFLPEALSFSEGRPQRAPRCTAATAGLTLSPQDPAFL